MSDIEEDVRRCEKLTEPQNANWIGLTNQLAIAGVLAERKQDKARIQELEEENRIQRKQIMSAYNRGWIPKQKVKDEIDKHKIAKEGFEKEYDNKHYKDDGIRARDFYMIVTEDRIIQVLENLLEDK